MKSYGYHILRRVGSRSDVRDQHRFPNAERALYLPIESGAYFSLM
jgi:hypothetical protein